jgi:hypothetical protein
LAHGGPVDNSDGVRLHAGFVELRGEDDAARFLRRADEALGRAREAASEPLAAAQRP